MLGMRRTRELSNQQFALVLVLPVLVFLLALVIYPLGYSVWLSVNDVRLFGGLNFTFVGLQNYKDVLLSENFWNALAISLRFTIESLVLTIGIGLGMAFVLALPMKRKNLLRTIAILPWAISPYATGILFKYLLRGKSSVLTALAYSLGSETTIDLLGKGTVIEALALGNAWNLAPLVGFFLLANLLTIPSGLYNLAKLDQLSTFERFKHVTLPYIRYTLFVFANVVTVLSLKVFDYIYVQTGGGPGIASSTLTYEIYKQSFINFNLGFGAALSFYLLILIVFSTTLLYVIWGRGEVDL